MNCRQGDLAVIVRSEAGNAGKIVRCIRLIGLEEWFGLNGNLILDYTWEIDRPLKGWAGDESPKIRDGLLRPIRPQPDDAVDEMVQKLGKPEGIPA